MHLAVSTQAPVAIVQLPSDACSAAVELTEAGRASKKALGYMADGHTRPGLSKSVQAAHTPICLSYNNLKYTVSLVRSAAGHAM